MNAPPKLPKPLVPHVYISVGLWPGQSGTGWLCERCRKLLRNAADEPHKCHRWMVMFR
jgi:hypothetical protein